MANRIELKTKDADDIIGDYYTAASNRGVILLHMMPADRKSWTPFAEKLVKSGFQALAIDLRGHGESKGGPQGYKNFKNEDHQNSMADVVASAEYLEAQGVREISLCGASIGANLALQYLIKNPDARSAVLLSPGLDYRGVRTDLFIMRVSATQRLYIAASDEDEYSYASARTLAENAPKNSSCATKFFHNSGHGTRIFENHPEFMDEITIWLSTIEVQPR